MFKYHMMLQGRAGFAQTIRLSLNGGGWPNHHINFIVAEKAQFIVFLALFMVYVRRGGWLKTSYGGRGLKLLKKTIMQYLNVSLW